MADHEPTPGFLPNPEHIAYLANLLTVLGILYAVWILHRSRRNQKKGKAVGGPGWTWGSAT